MTTLAAARGVRGRDGIATNSQAPGGDSVLPEAEAKRLLRDAGIAVPTGAVLVDVAQVPAELREPLVLKAVSPTLVHKSDVGGVQVGLLHADLAAAGEQMRESVEQAGHVVSGFLVEEIAPPGPEVVIGAVREPGLGWTVMVGLGGVFVEVLADVSFGVAPLTRHDIVEMFGQLRGAALLRGARGRAPVDLDALYDLVGRLAGPGGLLESIGDEIVEIDLNPVIVSERGAVAVDARFVRSSAAVVPAPGPELDSAADDFDGLFAPNVVAVLGAKSSGTNGANLFIRNLVQSGFGGRVVPVHPRAESIEGLPAAPSLSAIGEVVDYAYVALPAQSVAGALAAPIGALRYAQVVSSGFSEVDGGEELERALVERMRQQRTRLIGPNCLGTHSSRARLSFIPDPPFAEGGVSVVSQSGGLSVDILRLGSAHGVAFRTLTSIGNAADVTAAELVASMLQDPETTVVGLYLESLAAARAVHDVLARSTPPTKPVVLLAGGRTDDGSRAATSHTGALSGNHRLWPAIARQSGMMLVDTVEDFITVLLAFDTVDLTRNDTGDGIVVFGNGGGASVLAADALGREGLQTPRLPAEAIERLGALGLPPGNGLHNPIDVPAGTLAVKGGAVAGDILDVVLDSVAPAAVISHLNVGIIQRNLEATLGDVTGRIIDAIRKSAEGRSCRQVLVLKTDGKPDTEEKLARYAERARSQGIPAYRTFQEAALAARALLEHQRRRVRAGSPTAADHDQENRRVN